MKREVSRGRELNLCELTRNAEWISMWLVKRGEIFA